MAGALHWAVRPSFVAYVRDMGGEVEVVAPASEQDGEFVFPSDGEGFAGTVRFTAHGGMLAVTIDRPRIDDGRLTVADGVDRTVFAELTPTGADTWDARLSTSGAAQFGYGPYGPGTALAPVRVAPASAD